MFPQSHIRIPHSAFRKQSCPKILVWPFSECGMRNADFGLAGRNRIPVLLLLLCFFGSCSKAPALTVYGSAPDFSLTESSGKTITRSDLAGKVWVADFIFTSCGGTCPAMSARMRQLQDTLPQEIN